VTLSLLACCVGIGAGCKQLKKKASTESGALPAGADPSARRGPGGATDPRVYQETRSYMGTLFRIVVALRGNPKTEVGRQELRDSRRAAVEAVRSAFREVVRLEALLSEYVASSAVSRINQAAVALPTKAVKVTQEVFNLLHKSLQLNRQTEGGFDITFGPLSGLYRKPTKGRKARLPTAIELRRALSLIGTKLVALDYDKNTVRLKRAGMRIGLGGIAKGYTVDSVVAILRAKRLTGFIVDGGGDLYVSGRHPDRAWRVGIKDPRKPSTYFASLPVQDSAVVTSGDYERYFMHGGKRYHHILDPRTGRPATGLSSVTIVAPSATLADALATGAFVLGPRRGFALVKKFSKVECLMVTTSGTVLVTPGLRSRVKHRPPTKGP
jgi:thiamine biosynthesis lipoprotein